MSDFRKSRTCTISLQRLFPESIIAAGDDILVKSCSCRIDPSTSSLRVGHHIYIAGTDAGCDAGQAADAAIKNGATAILTDRLLPLSVAQCIVDDVPAAYAKIAHELRGQPSTKLLTIGVIGTHGKTQRHCTQPPCSSD
jgi:UDP-N-acetylmuramoyl-L-alanyl-D-glutamate--2,6-diaminopimelate ligase